MPTANGADNTIQLETSSGNDELPPFPGENFLAHAASQWLEQAEARLAARGLLNVAEGHAPASVKRIVDIPILPELPMGHRDYERRLESRTKAMSQNHANAQTRQDLTPHASAVACSHH